MSVMLRAAENVHVSYEPLPFSQGWLVFHVGAEHFRLRRIDKAEFKALFRHARETPQRIGKDGRHTCYLYRDAYFWAGDLPAEAWKVLEQQFAAA